MTHLEGDALAALVHGAAAVEPGARGGLAVHRLPAWARAQTDDLLFAFAERCAAGVSLRLRTDATRLSLTLVTTGVEIEGRPAERPHRLTVTSGEGAGPRLVDLPPGDAVLVSAELSVTGRRTVDPAQVGISLPPAEGHRAVEILLPHDAGVELLSLTADGEILPPDPDRRLRWTHYGSSISHGLEAPSPDRTWPQQVAGAQGWALRNLSFSGNAQLDGFVARIVRDTPADLITLKVGINLVNADSMRRRTMLPALHAFLDTVREGQPVTPIVLISAISCPIHEDSPGPVVTQGALARAARREVENDEGALTLAATRAVLADVVAGRADRDPHLHLVDGRLLFGPDDVHLLHDRLHPTAAGLDLIAARFVPLVEPYLPVPSAP